MRKNKRLVSHIILALITLVGCYAAILYKPDIKLVRQLTIGLGYVSLLFLVFTLFYGTWRLLDRGRVPVNFYLRRDVGIWSGITGLLHVFFGLQVHLGGKIALYFLDPEGEGFSPLLNLFGVSNYIGLLGTIILVILLLMSNDFSMRLLKGPLWKLLQRLNYILFPLVMAHTFGFQVVVDRERIFILISIQLTVLIIVSQVYGFNKYRTYKRQEYRPQATVRKEQ
ncbi:MAG: hypothetical protein FVQ83_13025 [Chloroflexi bacterium]|nr:hypothetical protein [Chloroflexota bacterium]